MSASMRRVVALVPAFLLLLPLSCMAHVPSVNECAEGSDFIHNAALARDGGMSEESFVGKIREDLELIQSFPPALRWFVQDDEDAAFLIGAATAVFRQPQTAAAHQDSFLRACLARTNAEPARAL